MNSENNHKDHRQRLKARYYNEGLDSFEDHNILEFLLFFGIPYKDTNDLAHELLNHFGSLSGVFEASREDLMSIKGIGENTATLLTFIPALSRKYLEDKVDEKVPMNNCSTVGKFLIGKYRFRRDEVFSVISLDQSCRFKHWDIISSGTINITAVSSRKVIETALKTSANAVILAHNHPNGLAVPSGDDIKSTIALVEALNVIGVRVLDHIIISDEDFVSLASSQQYKHIFK
ncbi:MAG: DNA repair protein RadC [Clostridia bacterium]|nr:DNA repair protein RadC [Clostridia bacterium]